MLGDERRFVRRVAQRVQRPRPHGLAHRVGHADEVVGRLRVRVDARCGVLGNPADVVLPRRLDDVGTERVSREPVGLPVVETDRREGRVVGLRDEDELIWLRTDDHRNA